MADATTSGPPAQGRSGRPATTGRRARPSGAGGSTLRILALAAGLGLLATVNLAYVAPMASVRSSVTTPLVVMVAAWLLAESAVVHLPFRRQAHSFSMSEVPLAIGLFVLSPTELVVAQLLGSALALALVRRQSPIKLVFNLAVFSAATSLAAVTFHLGVAGLPVGAPAELAVAAGAVLVASLLETIAVSVVIRLSGDRLDAGDVAMTAGFSGMTAAANACLGLIVVALLGDGRDHTLLLAAAPALVLVVGYRTWTGERTRAQKLDLLYETTRRMHAGSGVHALAEELLPAVREHLRAESAELVLWDEDGEVTRAVGLVGEQWSAWNEPRRGDVLLRQALQLYGPVVHARGRASALGELVRTRGWLDSAVVPLRAGDRVHGALLVADRLGAVDTFDDQDLEVLGALAANAAGVLEREELGASASEIGALREALEHAQAVDQPTGLSSRARLLGAADERVDGVAAMVVVDVDGLDDVRATRGVRAADDLLARVASRLGNTVRSRDLAARLDGDRFAVLVHASGDVDVVHGLVGLMATALRKPYQTDEGPIVVTTRVGVAIDAAGTLGGEELLARAQSAMAGATPDLPRRYATYREEMSTAAERRLVLRGALHQAAVDGGGIVAHYQPIIDLQTARLVGVEALARWRHSELGDVDPGEFLPVAAQLGIMRELGRALVGAAIADAQEWLAADPALGLTLNLATEQLADPRALPELEDLLDLHGIDAEQITIDVDANTLAREVLSVRDPLERLARQGVHIALDDFRMDGRADAVLASLPVDTIKVPSELLRGVGAEVSEELVRAVLEVGRRLDVAIVVEGIEAMDQLAALRHHGGTRAQGYLVAPPMAAAGVTSLLRALSLAKADGPPALADLIHLDAKARA